MERKRKTNKNEENKTQEVSFRSLDEVTAYFFPEGRPELASAKGKERGAKAADSAFGEIARKLNI